MGSRLLFAVFFLYIILQGALRKWGFPSLGTPLYLFQYALAFLYFLNTPKTRSFKKYEVSPSFWGILSFYMGYGVLEALNMGGTDNFIVQGYGLVMHFAFVPFVFCISRTLQDEETFDLYLRWLTLLLIPVFLLGVSQYFASPDALINRYATDKNDGTYEVVTNHGTGRVRIAGTFSYLATYASFLCFILHLLFHGVIKSIITNKLNPIYLGVFGFGFINLFMTGSRGPTGYYILSEGIAIALLAISGQVKFLKNLIPLGIALFLGFTIMMATNVGSDAFGGFMQRFDNTSDLEGRIEDSFSPLKYFDQAGLFGYGIGTAQIPMEPYLTNRLEMPGYWEEEGERIVIELGLMGYVIVMLVRWAIAFACYAIYKRIRKLEYKILAIQMTAFQLPFLINLQSNIFNYIDGMFYWIAIGFVYFAYVMDKKYKEKLEVQTQDSVILPQQ